MVAAPVRQTVLTLSALSPVQPRQSAQYRHILQSAQTRYYCIGTLCSVGTTVQTRHYCIGTFCSLPSIDITTQALFAVCPA